jgi:hypothetical protein
MFIVRSPPRKMRVPLDSAGQQSDTPREAGGLMGWAASKAVGLQI